MTTPLSTMSPALFNLSFEPPPFPLIDIHVHLGDSDTGELYYPRFTNEEYLNLMLAANIETACAFPPMRQSGYREENQKLADWTKNTDDKILPFARLGGRRKPITAPQLWMVKRKLKALVQRQSDLETLDSLQQFAGVKLLPHLDGIPNSEEFAEIARLELPVVIHGGKYSTPFWIEHYILPQIQTPLIIAHLGSFPFEEKLLQEAVTVAQRQENVYLDTSGVWSAEFVRYAVKQVPEKLVFGSDAPLAHPLVAWHHLQSIIQDEKTLEKIGYLTSKNILQSQF